MPRFEYRLNNAEQDYPALYFYEAMEEAEVAMRLICDYFVKEGRTWLKTFSVAETSRYVVYVEEADADAAEAGNLTQPVMNGWIAVEVREYVEDSKSYPLIHQFSLPGQVEALSYLIADSLVLLGHEWKKTSTEIDEDRQAYIYYCRKTGA
jgi:hypothetical protein